MIFFDRSPLFFLSDFFFVVGFLFFVGSCGIFVIRTNIISVLIALEVYFLGLVLLLSIFSLVNNDIFGIIFCVVLLTIAAAESALVLGILVVYYRLSGIVDLDFLSCVKG